MRGNQRSIELAAREGLGRLNDLVLSSVTPHSRRDLVRASAVMAGASALAGSGVRALAAPAYSATASNVSLQDGDIQTGESISLPFNPFGQPVTLDPHRTVNWGPFWVLFPHVWSGLLRFDENGSVIPDLAETVEPVDDAATWIATIRADLKFASGRSITAQLFVDSWKRSLDPVSPSPMAQFMEVVEGYDAFVAGSSTEIGFAATDDRTIEIRLSKQVGAFPSYMATFGWAILDLDVLNDPEISDPFLANAGAGQWRFTEFVDGDRLVMEPNPEYWDEPSPSIAEVTWRIVDGPDAATNALDLYREDEVISADIPLSHIETANGDETLSAELITVQSQSSTLAIGMDFSQEPFDDLRVRQAVAASIDKERWASELTGGEYVPAQSFVPPSVSLSSEYQPATLISTDPDRARELLADAGIDPETNTPDIVHYQPATDSQANIDQHAALLAMIEENSGLAIRHDTTLTIEQIAANQGDNGGRQFDIVWWWTVTDTAALLETAGLSTSQYMVGWFNWSPQLQADGDRDPGAASAEFDSLVTEAGQELDAQVRNDAYRSAEQLLLDNAVLIPLGHWVQRYVQKPWLQGTRQGPWSGNIPVRFDRDVVIRGRS